MGVSLIRSDHAIPKSVLLQGLAPSEQRSILDLATPRHFFARSVVVNQGDPAERLFLLIEGRARFFYVTAEGQKIFFPYIVPGEVFGLATAVGSPKYLVSTETLKHSRALAWDIGTVRCLVDRYPLLLHNMLSIAKAYIDWAFAAHIGLACHSSPYRLARTLVDLSRVIGRETSSGSELEITNEELAGAANVTPFTVSRLLSEWHRQGAVRKKRGKVVLRFPERLFALVSGPRAVGR